MDKGLPDGVNGTIKGILSGAVVLSFCYDFIFSDNKRFVLIHKLQFFYYDL